MSAVTNENQVENTAVGEVLEAHAEVKTGDESVLSSLGLNGQLFVFQLINFGIVFIVVWFMILKPLVAKMEERKKLVDESIDKAREAETNFQMSKKTFQEKIDEAKAEANKIMSEAHEQGQILKAQMKDKAKEEIDLLIIQAKKTMATEKEAMMADAKLEISSLVVDAMEKVIGEKFDSAKDEAYISKVVDSLK